MRCVAACIAGPTPEDFLAFAEQTACGPRPWSTTLNMTSGSQRLSLLTRKACENPSLVSLATARQRAPQDEDVLQQGADGIAFQ